MIPFLDLEANFPESSRRIRASQLLKSARLDLVDLAVRDGGGGERLRVPRAPRTSRASPCHLSSRHLIYRVSRGMNHIVGRWSASRRPLRGDSRAGPEKKPIKPRATGSLAIRARGPTPRLLLPCVPPRPPVRYVARYVARYVSRSAPCVARVCHARRLTANVTRFAPSVPPLHAS